MATLPNFRKPSDQSFILHLLCIPNVFSETEVDLACPSTITHSSRMNSNWNNTLTAHGTYQIISLHIRSMWETICDAWACWSGWKFGANSTEYPYSVIQNTPPPPKLKFRQILGLWVFSVTEYPPPQLKFRHILGLWVFSVTEYPPPDNWNLGRSWDFDEFSVTEYPPPPIFPMGNYV